MPPHVTRLSPEDTPFGFGLHGIAITDSYQNRRVRLFTPHPVDPSGDPPAPSRFSFPVDNTLRLDTTQITIPVIPAIYVRDPETNDLLESAANNTSLDLPPGDYLLELQTPIRVYIRVSNAAVDIESDNRRVTINLREPQNGLELGLRAGQPAPTESMTVPANASGIAAAISTFGDWLKTDSPEKSWPSLRDHPPTIQAGSELDVPTDGPRNPPATITVPDRLDAVYAAAPLAYYLPATVTTAPASETVTVATSTGETLHSGRADRFATQDAASLLSHVFTLDAITRTEGLYDIPLHARTQLSQRLEEPPDWGSLYDADPAERLARYGEIDADAVAEVAPMWRHISYVEPDPAQRVHLPYLVADLAHVKRPPRRQDSAEPVAQPEGLSEFMRGHTDIFSRYVGLPAGDAIEVSYAGERIPVGSAKLHPAAYARKYREDAAASSIRIAVVCNSDRMWEEYAGQGLYGDRDELPFEISVFRDTTVDELADVIYGQSYEFFHYIGHVESGFVCRDGELVPSEHAGLGRAGPRACLLNGCESYEMGRQLVEAGSTAAIITLSAVENSNAMRVGRTIACLVNQGFSPRSAVAFTRERGIASQQYIVLGDGGLEVAQSESGTPVVAYVESPSSPEGSWEVRLRTFPAGNDGMGAVYRPHLTSDVEQYLSGGWLPSQSVSREEVREYLGLDQRMPVVMDGSLVWSTDVEI